MDRSKLALWISARYIRRRDFVRNRGRSKSWVFRCGYCTERFNDEDLTHSERCARLAPISEGLLDRIAQNN